MHSHRAHLALPGSEEERVLSTRGFMQTEVWPLMLFAVVGMMLFNRGQ